MNKFSLQDLKITVENFKCFSHPANGWKSFKPINIVIGRNNSGKSALLDAVELAVSNPMKFDGSRHSRRGSEFKLHVEESIPRHVFERVFPSNTSGGHIGMNHWQYAQSFLDNRIVRTFRGDGSSISSEIMDAHGNPSNIHTSFINEISRSTSQSARDLNFIRVSAERDIQPEPRDVNINISPNGSGITNAVRAFINSDALPTEVVTKNLLNDINEIYLGDSIFTNISCQEDNNGLWEIFLSEENKENIRLSQSGSSLKTAFIIAAHLRFTEYTLSKFKWEKAILCIEEPENNLHPSLLRRLLDFLSKWQTATTFTLIITSHAPTCIDWASRRNDCQIMHVQHKDTKTVVTPSSNYYSNSKILDDLDVRASDILQANGIIWVEGPSDRIYLNTWINIFSDGNLREGSHYSILYYAGKLLSHLHALSPNDENTLVSLLSINRNTALIMDSDRHQGKAATGKAPKRKPRMHLNDTKKRVIEEIGKTDGICWITEGREIENYLSNRSIDQIGNGSHINCGMYDKIPESPSLSSFKGDKVAIAHAYSKIAKYEDMIILDLQDQLQEICRTIEGWNNLA